MIEVGPRNRKPFTFIAGILILLSIVGLSLYLESSRPTPLPELLRITSQGKGAEQVHYLEVPLVRYVLGGRFARKATVDFVGAVHLGDASYYEELNNRFKRYDAVLFELVSDGDAMPRKGDERGDSLLGTVQRAMGNLLGLSFQLDKIDYRARNFVHADLTPQQLSEAMAARGESLPQLLMKIMRLSFDPELEKSIKAKGFDQKSLDGINPLLIILRGPTPEERLKIKRFMAQGLIGSDSVLKMLEGESGFSLITDRNAAVMQVLEQELAAGKTKIAIFYGVGHLPDLHNRLTKERGLTLSDVEWLKAWKM